MEAKVEEIEETAEAKTGGSKEGPSYSVKSLLQNIVLLST
jgi:hypothetical protein